MAFQMNQVFEEWDDDDRMRMLFDDFRPKNVNPEGWTNKKNTWTSAINIWCRKTRRAVFSVEDLKRAFERNGLRPQCLEQVLELMNREGSLSERDKLFASSDSQSWLGWGVDLLVKQPLGWGWSTIARSLYGQTEAASKQFVHATVLEDISTSVLQRIEEDLDYDTPTMSVTKCQAQCKGLCDAGTFPLVFSQLQHQQKVTLFTEEGVQYIKVHAKEKADVTETDVGFVRLQKALQKVEDEIEKLRTSMDEFTEQAKAALKAGQKSKAQMILRRRKTLEKTVEQKMKTAEQLEAMIHKLQNTSSNQEVIGALKAGLNAQKQLAAKGMNAENVEDTMADIQDAFEEQTEIAQAMASGFNLSNDDSALEQELDEMLELEREKEEAALKLPTTPPREEFVLPEVPTNEPSPTQTNVQFPVSQGI